MSSTTISSVPTGEKSPVTRYTDSAYLVFLDGDVGFNYYASDYVTGSYGSPDRRLTNNGYFCNRYGYIAYDDYGVQYSYGKSPVNFRGSNICYIEQDGMLNSDAAHFISYGGIFAAHERQRLCVVRETFW